LREAGLGPAGRVVALLTFVFCSPLPALVFAGLEHSLQILLIFVFLRALPRHLGQARSAPHPWRLCLQAGLVAACRYEGLFVVLMACVLLFFRARRRRLAVALGLSAILPLVGYGLWAVSHGWYLVPTSVLLKGARPSWTGFEAIVSSLGGRALFLLGQRAQVAGLLVVALALRLWGTARAEGSGAWRGGWFEPTVFVFAGTTFLHYQFAGTMWFYRYEAYLAAVGVAVLALWAAERGPRAAEAIAWLRGGIHRAWPAAALLALVAYPLAVQGVRSYYEIGLATKNIREQHLQTARFIQRYYPEAAVALNDIGTTSFYTNARVLDLLGLGDIEVARAKLRGGPTRDDLRVLAAQRGIRIAILYRQWFTLPREWAEVGRLTIPDCVVGQPTIYFFAVAPDERGPLLEHLVEFAPSLPPDVMVEVARN
jgi:hypothetical protein